MYQLLLVIIYLAFISLGLPDALLGSAWPSMYGELDAAVSYAGIISMIIAGGTIISSILRDRRSDSAECGHDSGCPVRFFILPDLSSAMYLGDSLWIRGRQCGCRVK